LFVEAWERAAAVGGWKYAIDAVHMVAIAHPKRDGQVEWGRKGIALVVEHPDQKRWLPALYNNLGETHRVRGQYAEALECFRQCAQARRDAGREPDIYTTKDIAKMLRLLGRGGEALVMIEPVALELASKHAADGYISAEYGECLLAAGRGGEATPYLAEAHELLSKDPYMVSNEPGELRRLQSLARNASAP
jgi:tetratricopeptide (TPR) repeat protein